MPMHTPPRVKATNPKEEPRIRSPVNLDTKTKTWAKTETKVSPPLNFTEHQVGDRVECYSEKKAAWLPAVIKTIEPGAGVGDQDVYWMVVPGYKGLVHLLGSRVRKVSPDAPPLVTTFTGHKVTVEVESEKPVDRKALGAAVAKLLFKQATSINPATGEMVGFGNIPNFGVQRQQGEPRIDVNFNDPDWPTQWAKQAKAKQMAEAEGEARLFVSFKESWPGVFQQWQQNWADGRLPSPEQILQESTTLHVDPEDT